MLICAASYTSIILNLASATLDKALSEASHLLLILFTEVLSTILSGLLVNTTWRVLRMQKEETASKYGG
jgi:hypothetical protein